MFFLAKLSNNKSIYFSCVPREHANIFMEFKQNDDIDVHIHISWIILTGNEIDESRFLRNSNRMTILMCTFIPHG